MKSANSANACKGSSYPAGDKKGLKAERQVAIPIEYQGMQFTEGFRADLIIENKVIVELKSVEALNEVHVAQVLTYLKLSKCEIGLLMNFNVKSLKNGIKRLILTRK